MLGIERPAFTSATQAMEFFRDNTGYTTEETGNLSLTNGLSVTDKAGNRTALLNFLRYLSGKVPLRNPEDKIVLMTYLKDKNPNLRFISGFALGKALSAEPEGGWSATDMLDVESKGHRQMVERFAKAILAEKIATVGK